MIEIKQVTKRYTSRGQEITALDQISLQVMDDEFLTIIGPSGCGKTTLLKIIDGLVPHDSGEILINGRRVSGPGPDRAMVFQNFALMPWADILTNVAFPLQLRKVPKKEREEKAAEFLAAVGLKGFQRHYPHELSGGMQQRVGLARAMVADPQVLLMDEPFAAVDAQTRQLLQEDLLNLWQRERKTVIFITHSMDEAVFLSDRVVILSPRPGRVGEILEVPLPRPRETDSIRRSTEFVELTNYIWDRLRYFIRRDEAAQGLPR